MDTKDRKQLNIMDTQIVKLESEDLAKLPESKADQIRKVFVPMTEKLEEFEKEFNEIMVSTEFGIDKATANKAKKLRLEIAQVRIRTEEVRKAHKEESLRTGKAIDGLANILKWAVIDKEDKLKEIEKHEAIEEQKRLDELQKKREELLAPYVDEDIQRHLSGMADDVWEAYLQAKIKDHNHRIQAEREAEEAATRQKEIDDAELARVAKENAELKAKMEAEEEERKRLKTETDAALETERKIRFDAEAKANLEQALKDKDAKLIADATAMEAAKKLTAETKARREAEAKVLQQEAEAALAEEKRLQKIQDDLNKSDEEKMADFQKDLRETCDRWAFVFKSEENITYYEEVRTTILSVLINDESDGL